MNKFKRNKCESLGAEIPGAGGYVVLGARPPAAEEFCDSFRVFETSFNAIWMNIVLHVFGAFEKTKFLRFRNHLKKLNKVEQ